MFCSKIDYFLEIQPYIGQVDYCTFLLRQFEVNQTTFARSHGHMNRAFIHKATRENFEILSHDQFNCATNFTKLTTLP